MRSLAATLFALGTLTTSGASWEAGARKDVAVQLPNRFEQGRAATRPRPSPSSPAPKPREAAVPFRIGETLTYDVSWSSFLVAGTATSRVLEKKPSFNSDAYYVVVEGRPVPLVARLYNLFYKMDTLLDSITLLSQRGSLYSEEGTSRTLTATRFDRSARRAFVERQADKTEKVDFAIPPATQDGLAVLYALRGRAFKAGEQFSTPVADSGSLYSVQVEVRALEAVTVPAGPFTAWNMNVAITDAQGQPVWKNNEVWISSDARRLPVKLQAELPVGHFVLMLRDVQ
jgi:hypothetical protein